jgi:hypothetical protein
MSDLAFLILPPGDPLVSHLTHRSVYNVMPRNN